MDITQIDSFFEWAAYLSAAATVGTAVTGILFFTLGERFGKINDAVSVVQMLFMMPVAVGLFLLIRHNGAGLALLMTVVGISGMLVAAVLQALLVFGIVKYEQTITAVLSAGGVIGLWLVLADVHAVSAGVLPGGLALSGVVAGVGYILLAIGFRIGGHEHPLAYTSSMLVVVGYSIWAVWLGQLFASGRLGL